ncbi:hypothetical protein CYMTET_6854 [Cymbomonas tetramitiformis]|uniref:Uncharacterized protein n=1 Tax=Cymbomonas tetramitiformis TaxID=36881 RepID=A0AAE0LI23_9CHLO|nr:hypothetical protein CYMTET_6854 [Cymbomonas tetramitiformis]
MAENKLLAPFIVLLGTLHKVTVALVQATIDVIFVALLVVACLPPWRFGAVIRCGGKQTRHELREFIVLNFVRSVYDLLTLPIVLLVLLMPTRGYLSIRKFGEKRATTDGRRVYGYNKKLRSLWWKSFFQMRFIRSCQWLPGATTAYGSVGFL